MSDLCGRCLHPLADCQAEQYGDPKLILDCRETELENTKAQLAAALLAIEEAKLMRARLRLVDGSGEATICFGAALRELEKLTGART